MAIDSFEHTIFTIMNHNKFDLDDAFFLIDKLFDNIKNNNKHNSVIQMKNLEKNIFLHFYFSYVQMRMNIMNYQIIIKPFLNINTKNDNIFMLIKKGE